MTQHIEMAHSHTETRGALATVWPSAFHCPLFAIRSAPTLACCGFALGLRGGGADYLGELTRRTLSLRDALLTWTSY